MFLNQEEVVRYARHLSLPGFDQRKQELLGSSRVLVVGAGGLGCPALLYLAAAGVGTIGIVDHDLIELSNLQRQVIYTSSDVGKSKAITAAARIKELNPLVNCIPLNERITSHNALELIAEYDLIIDGTDNFPTRYLLNDACVLSGKPLVYGSVLAYEGQCAVFNFKLDEDVFSANYRDLFPQPPPPDTIPNCETSGVLGVIPGIIGCLQACEAIKVLAALGDISYNKLLIFDALSMGLHTFSIRDQGSRKHIKSLIDYDEFCQTTLQTETKNVFAMKEVSVQELKQMMDNKEDFQLIDVREPHEYDICNLGGELIPQGQIPAMADKISKDKKVIIHCRSGARSGNMVKWLEQNHHFTNLYNLKGGVLAWAKEIDPTMPTY